MQRYRIGVLMGGSSSEVQISLQSGQAVYEHLDPSLFEPYRIHILSNGWYVLDDEGRSHEVDRNDFSCRMNGQKVQFDALFNAIHGKPGEDGTLQGYLELLGIPYTGCAPLEMALTFDKAACNVQAAALGVPTAPSVHTAATADPATVRQQCADRGLRLPVFVKPTRSGSSFGVTKVNRWDDLAAALAEAGKESPFALVEQGVLGTEVGCGVARLNGQTTVLEITEIVSQNEFFDYEAKYQGASQEITPARLSKATAEEIHALAHRLYEGMHLRGVVRCDFIVDQATGRPTLIEINSVPGLGPASIVPQQVLAGGRTLTDFFTLLLHETLSDAQNRAFSRVL